MSDHSPNEGLYGLIDVLLKYARLLYKRKKLVIVVTVTGTFLVVAFCLISTLLPPESSPMPNRYSAYAILLVDQEAVSGGLASILASYSMALGTPGGGRDNINLILTILQSRKFLDLMAEEFSIAERYEITEEVKTRTRKTITRNTSYEHDPASSTLTLRYTDTDPEFATLFINRQIEMLEQWYENFGGLQAAKELSVLEKQLSNQESQIKKLEDQVKAFQRENNTMAIEDLAALQAEMIGDLRAQKIQIDLEIQTTQQFSQALLENENLINMRLQRDNLTYLISQLEQGYSGGEKIMPSIEELPELAIQHSKLQQELAIQSAIYQRLREQLELAKLNLDQEGFFSVLELAEIPEVKDSPSRSTISMIGAVISGLFGFFLALAVELVSNFSRKIHEKNNNE